MSTTRTTEEPYKTEPVRSPIVWIVNQGGHPYGKAARFGRLMSLTSGSINPFRPDRLMSLIGPRLQLAHEDDYVLISGLAIINALVIAMWLVKFPHVNILQWASHDRDYKEVLLTAEAVLQNSLTPPEVSQ